MACKCADPAIAAISTDTLEGLLVRCAERLSPEHHALLASLVAAFLLLSRLVREGRATLTRLRRLFGLRRSEKNRGNRSRVEMPVAQRCRRGTTGLFDAIR
jgi:hypothetical protein